jgi:hypothetical protein
LRKGEAAADPDAYMAGLTGWQGPCVSHLRAAVISAAPFSETIKWGHLVYLANGPAVLIRAEPARVLLGFWRGKRLREIEPRLQAGGKYEMARLVLVEGDAVNAEVVTRLAAEAWRLNQALGDPTEVAR